MINVKARVSILLGYKAYSRSFLRAFSWSLILAAVSKFNISAS
jgi:hypothetical protein